MHSTASDVQPNNPLQRKLLPAEACASRMHGLGGNSLQRPLLPAEAFHACASASRRMASAPPNRASMLYDRAVAASTAAPLKMLST